MSSEPIAQLAPGALRALCRAGEYRSPTAGACLGYTQANLVMLPKAYAYDFLLFCQRNPKPCPLLEVTDAGDPCPARFAPGSDLRKDTPRYRVFSNGQLQGEKDDICELWSDDMVSFLLGCSFTFESALLAAGIAVRHLEQGTNVPMYETQVPCAPAGVFRGNLVVSMRPVPAQQVPAAVLVTGRYPRVHGAPVHVGDPARIGIEHIDRPDFGEAVAIQAGELPVFWACGVTPQVALANAAPELAITHAPGYMFVTDVPDTDIAG
ncbi:MAG: putative hydro-lyase [Gammaproteobacteria bacterium]|nr:putative hydro-lyase [Gammaproteobacteria bacterium]